MINISIKTVEKKEGKIGNGSLSHKTPYNNQEI